jgi:hypothetical protein
VTDTKLESDKRLAELSILERSKTFDCTVSAKGGLQTVGKGLPISTALETGKYKLNNLNFTECIKEQSS